MVMVYLMVPFTNLPILGRQNFTYRQIKLSILGTKLKTNRPYWAHILDYINQPILGGLACPFWANNLCCSLPLKSVARPNLGRGPGASKKGGPLKGRSPGGPQKPRRLCSHQLSFINIVFRFTD